MPEDKEGKLYQYLIEDRIVYDCGAEKHKFVGFTVWADEGLTETILAVPGVASVITRPNNCNRYDAMIDPRYDPDWVVAEIEARLIGYLDID